MEDFFNHPFIYLTMPFISAIVGWGTNVVAIKMMFYPIEFVGKPPFLGWQGIVPTKAVKMASLAVDLMTSKLLDVAEVFSRLDPERIAKEMEEPMNSMVEDIVMEVMHQQAPNLWESIPESLKQEVYKRAKKDAPAMIAEMMTEIKDNIEELFDIKDMVITNLVKDKSLLNKIFLECGHKEFHFIGVSGFYFGFIFGVIQMIVWIFYKGDWTLPVAGLLVGYITNWLALKMIFEPKEPKDFGPFKGIQGLFLKRQHEVAGDYGALIAAEILNPQNIIEALLKGPSSDKLFKLISRQVKSSIDETAGLAKPLVTMAVGTKNYIEMKEIVVDNIMKEIPESMKHVHAYTAEALDIENTLREKMQSLTPTEFEDLLHPAFKEDEWILIAVGGLLGLGVGFFQLLVMF
ncbi:DUF445 domain-containing protein [Deltaproteobacteria bacterium TL4]